ncbi:U-box domain-containing protein 4-like [Canna indica]|uniref:U-box domain-containing protein 4-like n=1 Tax=Canna indica TaxID=4628 RepID=A0AAQ3K6C7_9LILI|nr:U-box domain-containing protein 4-like [Canna indica]
MESPDSRSSGERSGNCGGEARVSAAELQGIMERIRSVVEEERVQAALDIRRLTKTSSRNRRQLSPAVGPLVSMLQSGNSRSSEAAILGLLNLAVKDERNKISIVEAGALEPLTAFLESRNSDLQGYAAAALFTLSASSVNKPRMNAFGAIPLLINVLKDGNQQAKIDAIAALHSLSTVEDNLRIILSFHPIPPMISFLRTCKKSSKNAERCCALLESLVGFDEGRTALTAEEGGVLTVVEILEEGSLQSREHVVGALLTMCESDRSRYREVILREGVIPGLLELTVQGTLKSQAKARRLLELLRESTYRRSELQADTLENIVSTIVSKIDGDDQAQKAKKMLAEMVQISMEQSLRHLQRRALMCTPTELPPGNRRSEVSSK